MNHLLNKITQGNCLDVLKEIPDQSVHLIVTDPPYCIGASSNGIKSSHLDNHLMIPFFEQLAQEFQRVLTDEGAYYVYTDWRMYPLLYNPFSTYLRMDNLIVWNKMGIACGTYYRSQHELVVYGHKTQGVKRLFSGDQSDIWQYKRVHPRNKLHRAAKPVEMVERMITNSSKEGDIVLDCFCGSGTTAIAAINTNRNYIAIEIDPKMEKIADTRIAELLLTHESP